MDAQPIFDVLLVFVPFVLIAAVLGALALWIARWIARMFRDRNATPPAAPEDAARTAVHVRRAAARPATPAASLARLHLACGANGRLVAQAACEMAARWLAAGERVLLVDGGPRLRIHAGFALSPRSGLLDYLEGVSPLLAHVQHAVAPRFYVLVYGEGGGRPAWAGLGRLLEESRRYFDRVILALDPGASLSLGSALAREDLDAWWADPRPEQRLGARALAERLGITFNGIELPPNPGSLSDYLVARLDGLTLPPRRAPQAAPAAPAPPVAEPAPAPPAGPVTVDCDLHVLERLRFLLWMKRLQSQAGSRAAAAAGAGPPQPGFVTSG